MSSQSTAKKIVIGGVLILILLATGIIYATLKRQPPADVAEAFVNTSPKPQPLADAAKAFVNMLAKGDFKKAVDTYFDSAMRGALPADKLEQAWTTHTQATGRFLKIDGVRHDTKGGFDLEYVACKFVRGVGDVEVVFDSNHKVGGLWFVPHMEPPSPGKPSTNLNNSGAARAFVGMLAGKDFKKAVDTYFDSIMRYASPPDKLQQTWATVEQQAGSFSKIDGVRSDTTAGFDIEYVTCKFASASLDVKVVFDGSHQISGLWFVPAQSAPK